MNTGATTGMAGNWSSKTQELSPTVEKSGNNPIWFKLASKRLVINFLLIINFSTTLLVVALILRLKLLESQKLFDLNVNGTAEELVINGDVLVDTLIPEDDLQADRLSADIVEIGNPEGKAVILLDKDTILFEAQSYSIGESKLPISFELNNRVESLQVPNGMNNVKYVRAPIVSPLSSSTNNKPEDLVVESNEGGLELSGNLGVRGHSREVRLDASKQIHLVSKEESIHISATQAIFLSEQLPHENSYNVSYIKGYRKENKLSGLRQSVLVDPSDGQLYLS